DESMRRDRDAGVGIPASAGAVTGQRIEERLARLRVLRQRFGERLGDLEPVDPRRRRRRDELFTVSRLDVERSEVVVVGPEQSVLAEHLESAPGAAGEDLVPDADDRRRRPVLVTE